jgi:hypothetical protein
MDTAPRDGRDILAIDTNGNLELVHCSSAGRWCMTDMEKPIFELVKWQRIIMPDGEESRPHPDRIREDAEDAA